MAWFSWLHSLLNGMASALVRVIWLRHVADGITQLEHTPKGGLQRWEKKQDSKLRQLGLFNKPTLRH